MRRQKASHKASRKAGSRSGAHRSARKSGSRRLGRVASIFENWVNARPSYGLLSPGPGLRF